MPVNPTSRTATFQPRYISYAAAHGCSPETMLTQDEKRWPGGVMCGFILWMSEQWREWQQLKGYDTRTPMFWEAEHRDFDRWLNAKATLLGDRLNHPTSSRVAARAQSEKAVKIELNRYGEGWNVSTTRNGFQWSGFTADRELLSMLHDVLSELLAGEMTVPSDKQRIDYIEAARAEIHLRDHNDGDVTYDVVARNMALSKQRIVGSGSTLSEAIDQAIRATAQGVSGHRIPGREQLEETGYIDSTQEIGPEP